MLFLRSLEVKMCKFRRRQLNGGQLLRIKPQVGAECVSLNFDFTTKIRDLTGIHLL